MLTAILAALNFSAVPERFRGEKMVMEAQVWTLSAADRADLFKPMNNVNSFEPLVFVTRLESIRYHEEKR